MIQSNQEIQFITLLARHLFPLLKDIKLTHIKGIIVYILNREQNKRDYYKQILQNEISQDIFLELYQTTKIPYIIINNLSSIDFYNTKSKTSLENTINCFNTTNYLLVINKINIEIHKDGQFLFKDDLPINKNILPFSSGQLKLDCQHLNEKTINEISNYCISQDILFITPSHCDLKININYSIPEINEINKDLLIPQNVYVKIHNYNRIL